MNKNAFLVAAVFLSCGLGSATAARAANDAPNAMDRDFAVKVGQGNIAEVQSSRIALKKSQNKGVRDVATMLIKEHGEAQESLKQAGAKVKVKVPNDTDPMHKMLAKKLSMLSGTAFDKAYLTAQVRDHYKTIALFNKELKEGSNSTIQGFATTYLPGIETHTQHITAQAGKLGIETAAPAAAMAH